MEIDSTTLDKFVEDLFTSAERMKRIREFTNAELAEALEAHVLPGLGLQSDLVESAIERLKDDDN